MVAPELTESEMVWLALRYPKTLHWYADLLDRYAVSMEQLPPVFSNGCIDWNAAGLLLNASRKANRNVLEWVNHCRNIIGVHNAQVS